MNDEQRRIIIRKISSYEQPGNDPQGNSQGKPPPPINRWVALLIMIPVLALLAVLGVFFFTIFVALFSIVAIIFVIRIWWLRRKFRQHMQKSGVTPDDQQYDYAAQPDQGSRQNNVEDAEIIEETPVTRENKKAPDNSL